MAKKSWKEKEKLRLRRETEILKAQTKPEPSAPLVQKQEEKVAPTKNSGIPQVETKYIKTDLLRSLVLTIAALAIITAAYFLLK